MLKHPAWNLGGWVVVEHGGGHLEADHIDAAIAADLHRLGLLPQPTAEAPPLPLLVFASRHRAESGAPSLTTHPIGNLSGAAQFGGLPRTVCPTAPAAMSAVLRHLKRSNAEHGLGWPVTFEGTHHGPFVRSPTFFVEVGSGPAQWELPQPATVVAEALLRLTSERPVQRPVVLGFGGGHYVPRLGDLVLDGVADVGHLVPSYALDDLEPSILRALCDATPGVVGAYLHRKAIPAATRERLERMLGQAHVPVVRTADLHGSATAAAVFPTTL